MFERGLVSSLSLVSTLLHSPSLSCVGTRLPSQEVGHVKLLYMLIVSCIHTAEAYQVALHAHLSRRPVHAGQICGISYIQTETPRDIAIFITLDLVREAYQSPEIPPLYDVLGDASSVMRSIDWHSKSVTSLACTACSRTTCTF